MKKQLLFAMLWAFVCSFLVSCNSKKDSLLVKGSPYVYKAEDGYAAIITFEKDRTFNYDYCKGGWQDPDYSVTIQGKWEQKMTEDNKTIIVLKYDLGSLTPYDKTLYRYFEKENERAEDYEKNNEIYGFGPGHIGTYYNFVNNKDEVILYSISGNMID